MALTPGTRLGPYEVLSALGAGGMGEVYKARDTRLGRTVAVKVLPPDASADASARARFEREARAIATLSHPHICTVHDVGRDGETDYLVMELLEGETLAERLAKAKGPLPLDQVLTIGIAIADALDKAHRAGIVHRDLKPLNVMLTKAGPKLLDFGLAKLHGAASPVRLSDETAASTVGPGTAKGTILGTIHYMAPEQVEGREADTRSDIWALGAVLYEVATGQRPFDGESAASIVGAILKDTPPAMSSRQPLTPSSFEHVVERCLEKDPDERWQDVRDVKRQLAWIVADRGRAGNAAAPSALAPSAPTPAPSASRLQTLLPWALVVLVAAGAAVLAFARPSLENARAVQFNVTPPPGAVFLVGVSGGAALSPDGRMMAFVAAAGGTRLWVRQLDSLAARELPGTSGAAQPFWSPDGRAVGFFADGKLKRIDIAGGPPAIITGVSTAAARGASWGANDTIVFAPSLGPIQKISASGGVPVSVTRLDFENGESTHRWPQLLPDGRHLLYFVRSSKANRMGLYIGTLDRPDEKTLIVDGGTAGAYSPPHGSVPGHVLWVRGGALMAQAFDPERARLSGEPVVVSGADHVGTVGALGQSPFWLSREGTLVFSGSNDQYQLEWLSREGRALGTVAAGRYAALRMSPDGNRAAVAVMDESGSRDIWKMELARGLISRLTTTTGNVPVWSPDGREIAYHDSTTTRLLTVGVDGDHEHTMLESQSPVYINDWSPDGRFLLYTETSSTSNDLWLLPTAGDRKPVPLLATPFSESHGQFSPDGRWISYTSDESGQAEIYLRALAGKGSTRVSTSGGSFSRWRADGRELFYRSLDGKLMVVSVANAGDRMTVGAPVSLFPTVEPLGTFAYPYDVSTDGQRILAMTPSSKEGAAAPLTVIVNWDAGLRK